MTLGQLIRQAREKEGLTQGELAAALKWPQSRVAELETGKAENIGFTRLRKVCAALKTPPWKLLKGLEDKP
jgi:transcriptional regulator with XRE-family HTH domain